MEIRGNGGVLAHEFDGDTRERRCNYLVALLELLDLQAEDVVDRVGRGAAGPGGISAPAIESGYSTRADGDALSHLLLPPPPAADSSSRPVDDSAALAERRACRDSISPSGAAAAAAHGVRSRPG